MENKIILYGASGHCKVIIDILKLNNIDIKLIIDDAPKSKTLLGIEVVNSLEFNFDENQNIIFTIGNNKNRESLSNRLIVNFAKAIHPKSIIDQNVQIGSGSVVMAGAIINADSKIGNHCIVNTGSVVEHDCIIEDFVHISPNASLAGGVTVGKGTQIGIAATVIQGIKIGKYATIGAGAVIIRNVPDYAVVVGNPGKIIKYNLQ